MGWDTEIFLPVRSTHSFNVYSYCGVRSGVGWDLFFRGNGNGRNSGIFMVGLVQRWVSFLHDLAIQNGQMDGVTGWKRRHDVLQNCGDL